MSWEARVSCRRAEHCFHRGRPAEVIPSPTRVLAESWQGASGLASGRSFGVVPTQELRSVEPLIGALIRRHQTPRYAPEWPLARSPCCPKRHPTPHASSRSSDLRCHQTPCDWPAIKQLRDHAELICQPKLAIGSSSCRQRPELMEPGGTCEPIRGVWWRDNLTGTLDPQVGRSGQLGPYP